MVEPPERADKIIRAPDGAQEMNSHSIHLLVSHPAYAIFVAEEQKIK